MTIRACTILLALWMIQSTCQPAAGIELLYDFEGAESGFAIDKLTGDGSQDGEIRQNVDPDDTFVVPFGSQSAFFDLPDPVEPQGTVVPPYSTLEIPDSTLGADFSLTLAAFIRNDEDPQNFTRAFSSFSGTGPVSAERVILDFDSRESGAIPGIRAIIGNMSTTTPAPPAGMADPGYHHYALTVDNGSVLIYFDGTEVASGAAPLGRSNTLNIRVGEDPHEAGSANEQLIGNVDEVVMLDRALSGSDIALLAGGMTASEVITPAANELAVYYDFEGDSDTTVTDKFTLDGSQDGITHELAMVDTEAADAKLGSSSFSFQDPRVNDPPPDPDPHVFSQINVGPVGKLGPEFTLSAVVNMLDGGQTGGGLARIFSSFGGGGSPAGRLILDVNPNVAEGGIGTRLILPDGTSLQDDTAPALNENQTVTAVYNYGEVKLYLNGTEIATTTAEAVGIDLGAFDLRIGEDIGGVVNENFVGNMDDVMILRRALTLTQVQALHASGANALLATLPAPVLSGDYNDDGVVNVVDYTVWRDNLGSSVILPGDITPGVVDVTDYNVWLLNFGLTSVNPGSLVDGQNVPEPGTIVLGTLASCLLVYQVRRRR
ncbi:MAG: LamG-like jellyroll fold domain-containing protein [Aeoliella sp.]